MSMKSIWEDKSAVSREEKTLQAVAWLPNVAGNQVIVGTSSGLIKLIDVDKNRVLWKDELAKNETIFDLDISDRGMLAITLHKTVQFRKYDSKVPSTFCN